MFPRGSWVRHRRSLVYQDLKVGRQRMCRRVGTKATGLPAPIVVPPREELVCSRRGCEPWSDLSVEPRLLLMRVVHRHERTETVRTHVAGNDQEIAWRDVRQEPV